MRIDTGELINEAPTERNGATRAKRTPSSGSEQRQPIPKSLVRKILSFPRPANWDCLGGRRITAAACRSAIASAEARRELAELPLPRVAPSALGAVSLYWRREDQHFTIRVYSGAADGLRYEFKRSGATAVEQPGDRAAVIDALRRFLAQP